MSSELGQSHIAVLTNLKSENKFSRNGIKRALKDFEIDEN